MNERELEKDVVGTGSLEEKPLVTEDLGHWLNLTRLHTQSISMEHPDASRSMKHPEQQTYFLGFLTSHRPGIYPGEASTKEGSAHISKGSGSIYLMGVAPSKHILPFKIFFFLGVTTPSLPWVKPVGFK